VLQEDGGASVAAAAALYTTVIEHVPCVWRLLYSSWNRLPGMEWFRTSWMTRRFRETERRLRRLDPATVLTTHPLATAIAARMRSRGGLSSRLVAVLWDWHVQPFWCSPQVDRYLVSAPWQREGLAGIGIDPSRVTVSGLLVAPEFRAPLPAAEARARLKLPPDRPVVLVLGGGRGWGLERLVRAVARLRTPVWAVILCGSAERRARVERMLACNGSGAAAIRLLAFEPDPAPYYHAADLVVSKPSGLSLAQAFACGRPVLAVSPEPGHEEANLAELTREDAVLLPRPGEDLAATIERLLNHPAAREQAAAQGRKIAALDTEAIVLEALGRSSASHPAALEQETKKC
jgi:processive 1,2-diacylglycerol beta-glucosyltransferase